MTGASVSLLAKRKRGRPRKDGDLIRKGSLQSLSNPSFEGKDDGSMVGRMVHGVIEGSFDVGYFISVKLDNSGTSFRGVVFQPGKFIPVTEENDIAPLAKMYKRREIQFQDYSPQIQNDFISLQPENGAFQPVQASLKDVVLHPISPSMPEKVTSAFMEPEANISWPGSSSALGGKTTLPRSPEIRLNNQSPSVHPIENLRMVEQDDVMQVFEVSSPSKQRNINEVSIQDMVSESSFRGNESIYQKLQVHGKTAAAQNLSVSSEPLVMKTELQSAGTHLNELKDSEPKIHQNLFIHQYQFISQDPKLPESMFHPDDFIDATPKSPNLGLDLASTINGNKPLQPKHQNNESCLETNHSIFNQLKSPNIGYLQALVDGNPHLLPPDFICEPLEFMMEKPKSPPKNEAPQEKRLEIENKLPNIDESFYNALGGGDHDTSNAKLSEPSTATREDALF